MPAATISPNTVGAGSYTIHNSERALLDLSLPLTIASSKLFTIQYPTAAPVQIVLRGDPPPAGDPQELALLPAPAPDETTFAGRRITAAVNTVSATVSELACEIAVASGGAAGTDAWSVRVSGLGGGDCVIAQSENPSQATIRRLICDPVAEFAIGGGASAREKTAVPLTADPAIGLSTVVKQPGETDPVPIYRWNHDGDIAITDLPRCGPQTFSPTMPGVYGAVTFNITLDVDFDGACGAGAGFLRSAKRHGLTVSPRPQRLMLVLDRSGSMFGQKWTNAVTAARILVQLFAALRASVGAGVLDQVGIICFEDTTCSWHSGLSPGTTQPLALSPPGPASAGICSVTNLGSPGACTSIGDAIVRAMDQFAPGVGDDPGLTIVLLTDGIENAGSVVVGPIPPGGLPPGTKTLAAARAERPGVNGRLSLYTAGIGSYTQEDVLNALAADTAYRHITDVDQLSGALAQMVSFSLDAREVPPDPPNPGTPRVFRLESKVNRIAVAVEWGSADDALHLSRQLPGGTWQEEGTVQKCPDHGFITVDVAGLYGGVASVPETTWRLTHTSAGAEQPIADADVMFFVDLHATGDIVFDKPVYGTGEPMEITARLRVGNQGIRNATVKAEAAGPGESLGTLLATNGPQAIATLSSTVSTVATTSGKAGTTHPPGSSPDPFAVKAAVLNTILRRRGEEELPVWVPPSIFVDGTSELHEDASHPDGPGNYTNVFAQTAREGSYTFRFTIEATLPSGEPYHQVVTLSKWVGVKVDPFDSIFTIDILKTVRNLQYASVKVTPKDSGGQFLGPFRQDALVFNTTAGHFIDPPVSKAPLPAYSKVDNLDGSYTQVLEYPKGVTPVVTVEANGTALPPFVVSRGCLGALLGPLLRLVGWLVRLARRS